MYAPVQRSYTVDDLNEYGATVWNGTDRKIEVLWGKTCPGATLSTANPTLVVLGPARHPSENVPTPVFKETK
jgi:hypothetical protein